MTRDRTLRRDRLLLDFADKCSMCRRSGGEAREPLVCVDCYSREMARLCSLLDRMASVLAEAGVGLDLIAVYQGEIRGPVVPPR
ncbi:MAG TPA: hypothetical protein VGC81_10370 [Candidatus Methylomirabilis sp.]